MTEEARNPIRLAVTIEAVWTSSGILRLGDEMLICIKRAEINL